MDNKAMFQDASAAELCAIDGGDTSQYLVNGVPVEGPLAHLIDPSNGYWPSPDAGTKRPRR